MLAINDILEVQDKRFSPRYRVVSFSASGTIILFELPLECNLSSFPAIKLTNIATQQLHESIRAGELAILSNDPFLPHVTPPSFAPDSQEANNAHHARRDQAYEAVSWIIGAGFEILLTIRPRKARIQEAAIKFDLSPRKLSRWLGRYLTYGMTPNALYALHHKKGARGKPKPMSDIKRGRKPKFEIGGGCNVSQAIRKKIAKFAVDQRKKGPRTDKELCSEFSKIHFIDGIEIAPDGTETKMLLPQECRITEDTFIKYSRTDENAEALSRAKHGNRHDVDYREKLGSETSRALFAGEHLQVDFTILDCELVHPVYRHPIGRALGGLGCDVYSHFQAGIHVTMENASSLQGALLLENIFSEKVEFCRKLGIPITPDDWPGGFLWHKVEADNGELGGRMPNWIAKNLGFTFTNTAPYRPDQKGCIESSIGHLTGHELKLLPGYTPRQRQRGDKPCGLDAQLDPRALTKILALASMHRNRNWIDRHYLTLQAELDGIDPRPIDLFRHGILNSGPLKRSPLPDILRLMLFPRAKARIQDRGLFFNGLFYVNEMLRKKGAFFQARKRTYIDVVFDPRIVDAIYIAPAPGDAQLLPCYLSEYSQKYASQGLSFADIKSISNNQEYRKVESTHRDQQRQIDHRSAISDIVEEQKDRNNAAKGTVRSFSPANKREARAEAAKECANENARVLGSPAETSEKILSFPSGDKTTKAIPAPKTEITTKEVRNQMLDKLYGDS